MSHTRRYLRPRWRWRTDTHSPLSLWHTPANPQTHTHTAAVMKTDSPAQAAPFASRKQSLIEDARRERSSGSAGSPGPTGGPRHGDAVVFEDKDGRVTLNVIFTLSSGKNAGFFKAGKIFEVYFLKEILKFKFGDWCQISATDKHKQQLCFHCEASKILRKKKIPFLSSSEYESWWHVTSRRQIPAREILCFM